MQADAQLHLQPLRTAHRLGIAPEFGLHRQGGITGARGMILMSNRRAKEDHDPIPHHLVHGPLIAMYGRHHPFQHGIEQLSGFLGIAVGEEFHRIFEIGEEHGHLFAFTFEGTARGQNLFGQVLRGRDQRRTCYVCG